MNKEELIYLASKCVDKGWDFETLKYGDDLYGKESFAEDVWIYVKECKEIGSIAFKEKYNKFNLY